VPVFLKKNELFRTFRTVLFREQESTVQPTKFDIEGHFVDYDDVAKKEVSKSFHGLFELNATTGVWTSKKDNDFPMILSELKKYTVLKE